MNVLLLQQYALNGISRMAVVVHETSNHSVSASPTKAKGNRHSTLWTATDNTKADLKSNAKGGKGQNHWTLDYLKAAEAAAADPTKPRQNILGIRCPCPVGIVTFEDIIDTILQKTSRDESDFFDRDASFPPTKTKKPGDYLSSAGSTSPNIPRSSKKAHVTFDKSVNPGTLRQRKVSNNIRAPGNLDGADEGSFDGHSSIRIPKRRSAESSYTSNSRGGFHDSDQSRASMDRNILMTAEEILEMANTSSSGFPGNPYSRTMAASPPAHGNDSQISRAGGTLKRSIRNTSAALKVPIIRRVGPFSRGGLSSFEKEKETQTKEAPEEQERKQGQGNQNTDNLLELTMPVLSALPEEQEMSEMSRLSTTVSQCKFCLQNLLCSLTRP